MIYPYRNNHNITGSIYNKYFAIWSSYIFLHEEICVRLTFRLCIVLNQWEAKWYQIVSLKKMRKTKICWCDRGALSVFLWERLQLLWSSVRYNALSHLSLIRSAVLKKLLFHAKNILQNYNWDCDQYYLQQMLWKNLNEALLDRLHH